MSNNVYGIDLGTNNFKVYSKATGKTMLEKNTIAVIDKNQIYAYGDSAYAMYEKAPETINVIFPVVEGVIADYNLLQTMIFDFLEHKTKARIKNAEFIIAVPTDITDVEKRAFYELFYKSKSPPKKVMLCEKPIAAAVGLKDTTTGDTLCDENHPIVLESMEFPDPVISVAVEPKTKADQEKMGIALQKLAEEDPTFRVRTDAETGQTIISGMG